MAVFLLWWQHSPESLTVDSAKMLIMTTLKSSLRSESFMYLAFDKSKCQFFSKATWSELLLIILGQILEIGFMQINILVILHIEFNSQFNPVKINCTKYAYKHVGCNYNREHATKRGGLH